MAMWNASRAAFLRRRRRRPRLDPYDDVVTVHTDQVRLGKARGRTDAMPLIVKYH